MISTDTANLQELTHRERVAVLWLLTWRFCLLATISSALVGFVLGIVVLRLGADQATSQLAIMAVSAFVSFFVVGPLLVLPMMLRKKYSSFSFEIRRNNARGRSWLALDCFVV